MFAPHGCSVTSLLVNTEQNTTLKIKQKTKKHVVTGPVEVLHGDLGSSGMCVRRVWCVRCGRRVCAVCSAGLDGGTRGGTSRRPVLQPVPGLLLENRGTQQSDRWSEFNLRPLLVLLDFSYVPPLAACQ